MKLWMRGYVLAFVAVSLVALTWSIAARLIATDYGAKLQQGEARAIELARFFERDTQRILNIAEVYVREAVRLYELGGVEAVTAFMGEMPEREHIVSHITIANALGEPVFVSGRRVKPGTSLADRAYFQLLKNTAERQSTISLPLVGRNTGVVSVRFVRRVENPDGSFAGVAFAAINADQFTAFFNTLGLGPNSSATVAGTDDQRIRARSSYGRLGPGQDISGSRIWRELQRADQGLYVQTSVVDDVTRYYAYRKLPEYPLLVAIGLARDDIVQDAQDFAGQIRAIAALTTLVILISALMVNREMFIRRRMEREIAERRAAERDLAAANTDLMQYAYSASHDLKAPLTSIWGLLDFCLEDLDGGNHAELRQNLIEARDISQRSSRKVENLLRIAQSNSELVSSEEFLLAEMISDIWSDQTAVAAGAVSLELDVAVHTIHAERSSVHLILENLISNGLRYADDSKPERFIAIQTEAYDAGVVIRVRDNGVGIPDEFLRSIFDQFKSFDDRGGDGLGLALVEKHVLRLGGTIDVTSRVGEGTCFEIKLPLSERESDDDTGGRGRRQQNRPIHDQTQALAS